MIIFQLITEDLLDIALEILNSNPHYNILVNGNPSRTLEEVGNEFINQITESYFIKLNNKYIGIIDFLENNPNDNCSWIGLLMIHGDYHSMGYGSMAYLLFEEKLRKRNLANVRIGILKENSEAKRYWSSLGFAFYDNAQWENKRVECFEKKLI